MDTSNFNLDDFLNSSLETDFFNFQGVDSHSTIHESHSLHYEDIYSYNQRAGSFGTVANFSTGQNDTYIRYLEQQQQMHSDLITNLPNHLNNDWYSQLQQVINSVDNSHLNYFANLNNKHPNGFMEFETHDGIVQQWVDKFAHQLGHSSFFGHAHFDVYIDKIILAVARIGGRVRAHDSELQLSGIFYFFPRRLMNESGRKLE